MIRLFYFRICCMFIFFYLNNGTIYQFCISQNNISPIHYLYVCYD